MKALSFEGLNFFFIFILENDPSILSRALNCRKDFRSEINHCNESLLATSGAASNPWKILLAGMSEVYCFHASLRLVMLLEEY